MTALGRVAPRDPERQELAMCNASRIVPKFRSVPQAIRAAIEMGATYDEVNSENAVQLDAPAGKLWASTLSHSIAIPLFVWRAPRKSSDVAADIAEDLSYGFCDCSDTDCDTCCDRADESAND